MAPVHLAATSGSEGFSVLPTVDVCTKWSEQTDSNGRLRFRRPGHVPTIPCSHKICWFLPQESTSFSDVMAIWQVMQDSNPHLTGLEPDIIAVRPMTYGANTETQTQFSGLEDRGTIYIPCSRYN